VVAPRPDITFQLLDGAQAAAHADELQALHAEVYAKPPYARNDDAALFAERFRIQRRQPGFVLAEARHGGYLVGYAAGDAAAAVHLVVAGPDYTTAGRGDDRVSRPYLRVGRPAGARVIAASRHRGHAARPHPEKSGRGTATLIVLPAAASS
jgi:hypothetical protein